MLPEYLNFSFLVKRESTKSLSEVVVSSIFIDFQMVQINEYHNGDNVVKP